jgi:hypothetical protein
MANTDVINLILLTVKDYFTYMLPIIGIMAGIVFIFSALMYVTIGLGRHTFKG